MDALLASFFLQSALASVFLVALVGIAFVYRRALHVAMAIGWSAYLLQLIASLTAAWLGRMEPEASRQWPTATLLLLAVLCSCLWWVTVIRILAGQESRAVVSRPLLAGAVLVAIGLLAASLCTGRILHQPGSGPLGWLYPIPYLVLAFASWRSSLTASDHRRALRWLAFAFLLFVARLVIVTNVILPESTFSTASLPRLLSVGTVQIVQMVTVGIISIGIAVAYERTAVLQQAARMQQFALRLQRSERLEMLGRMAAGIAHDFNNVLCAISAGVDLARDSVTSPATVSSELVAVDASVQRAVALALRLTTFAKTGQSVSEGLVNVDDILRANAAMLERIVGREHGWTLEANAPGAQVRLDRAQMEQVLLNLVVNARDATPKGGTISVSSRIAEFSVDRRVHDGVLLAGRYVCVSVVDTGIGMSPDVLPHIFVPFFSTKGADAGSGIGLATVQQIVLSVHGDIEIASIVGAGSRFDVSLPVAA